MREIKFRAWDGIRMTTSGISFNSTTGEVSGTVYGVDGNEINMPVMQFTGLKDKNGVEIYEGDIVRLGKEDSPTCEGEVYSVASGAWCCCGRPIISPLKEIIGNIYENPDLINQTNGAESPSR